MLEKSAALFADNFLSYPIRSRAERALLGSGGINEAIARVCEHIYDDEFDHMLPGLIHTDRHGLSAAEWELLGKMTVEQLRCRIRMRNAQFGFPVAPARIEAMCAGQCAPLAFDYERAQHHRVSA